MAARSPPVRFMMWQALTVATALFTSCSTVYLDPAPADVNACRPSQMFFATRIWPEFLGQNYGGKTCSDSRCHDATGSGSLYAVMPASVPSYPFAAQSDWERTYLSVTSKMICTNVRGSRLYTDPAGLRPHFGGKLIEPEGPEAALLEMWVAATP